MNLKDLLDRSLLLNAKLNPNSENASLQSTIEKSVNIMQSHIDLKKLAFNLNHKCIENEIYSFDV